MRLAVCMVLFLSAAFPAVRAGASEWFGDEAPVYVPRERIVLFELPAPGLEYTEQISLNYAVSRELAALAYYNILYGDELKQILGVGRLPECSDADCRTRVARAAGAVEYIHGGVSGRPDRAELVLERVRTESGEVIARQEFQWRGGEIHLPSLAVFFAIQLFIPREALLDGQLQLDVKPRLASIRVDGAPVLVPSANTIRLEPGIHMLEIAQAGYRTEQLPVVILPRRVQFHRVELKPK